MFDNFFKRIASHVTKEVRTLKKQNQEQAEMIEKLLTESNGIINQLKTQKKSLMIEKRDLLKEVYRLKIENNKLKNLLQTIKIENKAPVPKSIKRAVLERDNYTCLVCGSKKNLTLDHIKPRFIGGPNDIDNLQILCKQCNLAKGIDIIDYRKNIVET